MGIKSLLSHSFRIAQKDLHELFRNRLGLVLLILMPLFMMAMVGFIYPTGTTYSNLPVAFVNEDSGYNNSTAASQALMLGLQQINNNTRMLTLSNASSVSDLQSLIQKGDVEGGIIIPSNFSSCVMNGQQGTIIIMTDQSNPEISATIQSVLTTVFNDMGTILAQLHVQALNPVIVNSSNSLAIVQPYTVQTEGVVPGHFNYFDFIAPGIIAMTVMMSVMTGLPAAISMEKEVGTMDGMMVAPINRLSIILGKTLGQTARGLIQGLLILVLSIALFGVIIHGSLLLVLGLLLLGVFSFVGLGVVITSFAKDQETATMLMMTLMFPMMFLSGVFFPIQQMPWYMQDISKVLPLTYASDALRKVMVLGAGVPDITTDLIIMIVFGAVMIAIAVPVFRRAMSR
jgi:ABC-2 type transport system permease protein